VIVCSVAFGENQVVEVSQNDWEDIIETLIKEM